MVKRRQAPERVTGEQLHLDTVPATQFPIGYGCRWAWPGGTRRRGCRPGAFLEEVAPGRPPMALAGEPGIGKTALLDAAAERAAAMGLRVVRCGGVEYETEISFSGLHQSNWREAAGALNTTTANSKPTSASTTSKADPGSAGTATSPLPPPPNCPHPATAGRPKSSRAALRLYAVLRHLQYRLATWLAKYAVSASRISRPCKAVRCPRLKATRSSDSSICVVAGGHTTSTAVLMYRPQPKANVHSADGKKQRPPCRIETAAAPPLCRSLPSHRNQAGESVLLDRTIQRWLRTAKRRSWLCRPYV